MHSVKGKDFTPYLLPIAFCKLIFDGLLSKITYKNRSLQLPLLNELHAVVQLVEALHYKPERRGFDSRLCHGNF